MKRKTAYHSGRSQRGPTVAVSYYLKYNNSAQMDGRHSGPGDSFNKSKRHSINFSVCEVCGVQYNARGGSVD